MEDRILADLKESYGITCHRITPVTGGLLNLKWKVSTKTRDLLVKQFSTQRFCRERIDRIEAALQRQVVLEKHGVPCPLLWQRAGHIIRWLDDSTAYMVMDFRQGKTETSDTITIAQMRSLGSACAIMHRAFAQLPEPLIQSLPASGGYSMELLRESLRSRVVQCPPDAPDKYRKALHAQELILRQLGADFFDPFPKGFAHEDFHAGNILFKTDGVSAIVDFDRNCYSYVWHDVGRAILSFALEGSVLNVEKVCAFREGYSRHCVLTLPNIADALRLSWCIEMPWWIQPEFFGACDEIPRRFKDEMLWLSEHWFELDSLLCS